MTTPDHRLRDDHRPGIEVEVLHPQSRDLTAPQAGHRTEVNHRAQVTRTTKARRQGRQLGGVDNEDWVGATATLAVVLDGITTPTGMGNTGCSHGTPWLVASIGSSLIAQVEQQPELDLVAALAGAIEATAARHGGACDLNLGATPAAAVAAVRVTEDALSYLVLSDAAVVVDTRSDNQVITDLRGHGSHYLTSAEPRCSQTVPQHWSTTSAPTGRAFSTSSKTKGQPA